MTTAERSVRLDHPIDAVRQCLESLGLTLLEGDRAWHRMTPVDAGLARVETMQSHAGDTGYWFAVVGAQAEDDVPVFEEGIELRADGVDATVVRVHASIDSPLGPPSMAARLDDLLALLVATLSPRSPS